MHSQMHSFGKYPVDPKMATYFFMGHPIYTGQRSIVKLRKTLRKKKKKKEKKKISLKIVAMGRGGFGGSQRSERDDGGKGSAGADGRY